MARQAKLSARPRTATGRGAVARLRRTGVIPAVIYGAHETAANIEIAARDLQALLKEAVGENLLVELEIDDAGAKSSRLALIQEIQHAPVGGAVLHVDLHAVRADEVIHASIPLEPTGEAEGVKTHGGILEQAVRALNIVCLPKDLPEVLRIDVSALGIGDAIHVKDLQLPPGVEADVDGELTVFLVAAPTVAEEEAAPAEAAPTEPEVIREKKETAEGGGEK